MVNAQQWLDIWYPKDGTCRLEKYYWGDDNENYGKKREEITRLDISYSGLYGKLDLSTFKNLEKIECHHNKISDLVFNSPEKANKLKEINCKNNKLTKFDLSNSFWLEKLDCSYNELSELLLPSQISIPTDRSSSLPLVINYWKKSDKSLYWLSCKNNNLPDCKFLENCVRISWLNIGDNKISSLDLNIFAKFTELEYLGIGSKKEKEKKYDGLEIFRKLNKLKILNIENVWISNNLFLPENLEYIYCDGTILVEKLKNYEKMDELNNIYFDYWAWKRDSLKIIMN